MDGTCTDEPDLDLGLGEGVGWMEEVVGADAAKSGADGAPQPTFQTQWLHLNWPQAAT